MVGLYKDPKGENIFPNSSTMTSKSTYLTDNDDAMSLQNQVIKKLQDEIKDKDVMVLSSLANNLIVAMVKLAGIWGCFSSFCHKLQ